MKIASLFAGLVFAYCGSSFAAPHLWSGNQLSTYYRAYVSASTGSGKSRDLSSFALYLGYIRGAYEILAVSPDAIMCMDESVTLKQIGDVVGRYMMEHPKQLDLPASFLVRKSLKDAFPCK
ncbi:MAG: Rap1a/Tai family immunity protein [Burkholderiales bacterium]